MRLLVLSAAVLLLACSSSSPDVGTPLAATQGAGGDGGSVSQTASAGGTGGAGGAPDVSASSAGDGGTGGMWAQSSSSTESASTGGQGGEGGACDPKPDDCASVGWCGTLSDGCGAYYKCGGTPYKGSAVIGPNVCPAPGVLTSGCPAGSQCAPTGVNTSDQGFLFCCPPPAP